MELPRLQSLSTVPEESIGHLMRRVRSVEDRRVVNIELTDAGSDAAKAIPGVLCPKCAFPG